MKDINFNLEISYSQIGIFLVNLDDPFNEWNENHIAQGFSWRKESVCFGTLSNEGQCRIVVGIRDKLTYNQQATRVIVVPFVVEENGIEVASITEGIEILIPKGNYEIVFSARAAKNNEDTDSYEIFFVKKSNPSARIIIADEELNPPATLDMHAIAAE